LYISSLPLGSFLRSFYEILKIFYVYLGSMENGKGRSSMVGWVRGTIVTALVAGFGQGVLGGFHALLCVIYDITLSTNATAKAGGENYMSATRLLCRGAPGKF
jgi:hypothetical protein